MLRDREVVRFDDQPVAGDRYAQSSGRPFYQGFKSAVYVPMPTGRLPLGIAVFKRLSSRAPTTSSPVLHPFAGQAANAVESFRRADE